MKMKTKEIEKIESKLENSDFNKVDREKLKASLKQKKEHINQIVQK